jgi:hypothetical protein
MMMKFRNQRVTLTKGPEVILCIRNVGTLYGFFTFNPFREINGTLEKI